MLCICMLHAQTYYYSGSGALNATGSWGTNTDGSGTHPATFSSILSQVFEIRNTTAVTLTGSWTVSGIGSKVVLGNAGVSAVTLTLASTASMSATLDIASASSGSNTLVLQGTTSPNLGTISSTSTIQYDRAGTQAPLSMTYGNLVISNSGGVKTAAGAITVAGKLTIASGCTFNMSTFQLSGITSTSGTGVLQTASTASAPIPAAITWTFDVTYNGASQTISSGNYINVTVAGSGTKVLGGTTSLTGSMSVTAGTLSIGANTLTVAGSLTGSGAVSFTSGTLLLGGDFSNTGTLTTGTGTIHYNGTSSQIVRAGTYYNLTFSNAGVKSFTGAVAITAGRTMLVNAGANVDAGTFQVTATGATATITINGSYATADQDGFSGGTNTAISSTNTSISPFTTTSEIRYNAAGDQFVTTALLPYGSLTLTGSGTKTIASNFTMLPGTTLTLASGVIFDMGTRNIQNSAGTGTVSFIINGTFYTRLQAGFSGGATAINGTGTSITLGASSVIEYGRSSAQTVSSRSDYVILRLSGNATKTLDGPVTVSDSLDIIDADLALGSATLTVNGKLGGAGTLTGSAASGLVLGGSANNVTLHFTQTSATTRTLNNFTVNRTSSVVTLGDSLRVAGTLTLSNGTLATGGKLVLLSDATSTARVAAITGTGAITGNVTVQRYIPSVGRRWRFMSSPVSNTTLEDWRGEIFITGAGVGNTVGTLNSNGFDATLSNQAGVYYYVESVPGTSDIGWTVQTNNTSSLTNVPLPVGKGYRVFVRGDRSSLGRLDGTDNTQNEVTITSVGTINTGDIALPVSFTNTGGGANDGYNLVGNPYPGQYDWNAFWDQGNTGGSSGTYYTNIDATIYIFDAQLNNYRSYNALTNSGTFNGVIASGQSFFAIATGASPAITFKEQFKTATVATQMFKTNNADELLLRMERDFTAHDDFILKLHPGSVAAHDAYDSYKMQNPDLNLAGFSSDHILHMLDSRPLTQSREVIGLSTSGSAGDYQLVFKQLPQLQGRYLYLHDALLNTLSPVDRAGFAYAFTLHDGDDAARFNLVISDVPVTATIANTITPTTHADLYPNPAKESVNISSLQIREEDYKVQVYSLQGALVNTYTVQGNNGQLMLPMHELQQGMYLLHVTAQDGTVLCRKSLSKE